MFEPVSASMAALSHGRITPLPTTSAPATAGAAVDPSRRSSPIFVWVRQRQDDALFLLPEASARGQIVSPYAFAMTASQNPVVVTIPPGEGDQEEEGPMAWEGDDIEEEGGVGLAEMRNAGPSNQVSVVAYDASWDLRGHAGEALWRFSTDRWVEPFCGD